MDFDPTSAVLRMSGGQLAQVMTPAPAGPSYAAGGSQGGASFDSSGWNVNFGGGDISSTAAKTPLPGVDAALSSIGQYVPYIAAALVLAMLWKHKKR